MKHSNEVQGGPACIRRTLKIADFETLTFEYPLFNTSNNPLINFWLTVEFVDTQLAEWANHIAAGHQANIGKGPIDRLITEINFARQKIAELQQTENK